MIDQVLRRVLFAAASVALLAVAWLAIATGIIEHAISAETIKDEGAIAASVASVPKLADTHLVAIEAKVDAVTKTAAGAIATIDKRLASIQADAKGQLTTANRSIASVTGAAAIALPSIASSASTALASVSADVHQVAAPIAGTAAQLNDAAPMFLDCEFNPDCAFNRFQGVSKATEQTMQAVAKAAPQMTSDSAKIAGSVAGIASDAKREADELVRPKRWYQRLLGYLTLGGEVAAHLL